MPPDHHQDRLTAEDLQRWRADLCGPTAGKVQTVIRRKVRIRNETFRLSRERLDDLEQDVFVTLMLRQQNIRDYPDAYIERMVRNHMLNAIRNDWRSLPLPPAQDRLPEPSRGPSPADHVDLQRLKADLRRLLDGECQDLYDKAIGIVDRSWRDIAAGLDIEVNTAQVRGRRLVKRVSEGLEPYRSLLRPDAG